MQDELGKSVEGIELPRFTYQAPAWSRLRWVIEIRQHIERRALPKGKTLSLFADDPVVGKYRFSALTTDLNLSAEIIWRIYRGRADCESRIKELKYDFATDSFNKTTAESLKIVRRKIYRLCARKYDAATTFAYAIALDCPSHRRPMPQARYKSPPAPPARQKYRPAQNQTSPR